MSQATYYLQRCPICGRQLQVRVEYLGRKLSCQHCQGSFLAAVDGASIDGGGDTLTRAAELLASAERPQP